ncbi:DUF1593 domain-containing protein [Cytophagaceae bacterium SJW1-29]|uniref:DUF1593 domain-containing protein n=2 Tax=Salmonirosea aquatica TaxID=2654236 RepID=A0A7C9BP80_9BACT|nr:DUF1593 domain-containing protein [Cytophagaceae bacterium SJW1-29]
MYCFTSMVAILALFQCNPEVRAQAKPRILISTDIGGTDPDDFQSMIHLLMYADRFQIEGLVSSPFGNGRKKDILDIIDLYEKDLGKLKKHSYGFPAPDALRKICKQGAILEAPYKGYTTATEGSDWIISCAKKKNDQPLWVLLWGGIEDLAQALHDAPEIKENIRVYWIGGPNKKWSINPYAYIAEHHPNLWMIEANATYRGWFMDPESPKNITSKAFYGNYIQGRGAMGKDFINYYKGDIKMGDTPSLAYLMKGNPDNPTGESWGGSFTPIDRSSRTIFERNTTTADTVATYSVVEWWFKGPKLAIPADSACFTLDVSGQSWPGYYLGDGQYGVRYSPKQVEVGAYMTHSSISELDGQKGKYVSVAPWPGKPSPDDYILGRNWYGDRTEPELFLGTQQGAKTVSKHREEYLMDWAKRWEWLK